MGRGSWKLPEIDSEETPLGRDAVRRLERTVVDEYDADCDDICLTDIDRDDSGSIVVQFVRTFEESTRGETFESIARRGTDGDWTLEEPERIGVTSIVGHEGQPRPPKPKIPHLDTPLDLSDEEYGRLDAALKASSEKYRKAREGSSTGSAYSGYYGSIFYLERVNPDTYTVLFFAMFPQKPAWSWELRTRATRTDDGWDVGEIDTLANYNWV